jgi:ADP-ribose pyrophosphatase
MHIPLVRTGGGDLFRDSYLGLREDILIDSRGREYRRKVVEYNYAAAVLPMTSDGKVLLVRHYRHPVGREILDIPGGMIESGETAEEACARELLEETGYTVEAMEFLSTFYPEPAMADHEITLFLGTGLILQPTGVQHEEEIRKTLLVPFSETYDLILTGGIASSWTIIAVLLARNVYLTKTRAVQDL